MCRSKTEGGVRCYGHGLKAYEGARARLAGLPDSASTKQVAKAEVSYETAVDRFAANRDGHKALSVRMSDIQAGAPLDGDRVTVIEVALADHAHVARIPRPRSPLTGDGLVGRAPAPQPAPAPLFATDLAQALRTDLPMREADRVGGSKPAPAPVGDTALALALRTGEKGTDTPAGARPRQATATPLATALRTGETTLLTDNGDIDDGLGGGVHEPVTLGGITVARGQVPFLKRWGNDTVTVNTKMHVQHFKGDGWSEYDLATESYKPVTDTGATVGATGLFAKDTGVLVVENARTGEKAALRARRDTTTGHWQISEDITA